MKEFRNFDKATKIEVQDIEKKLKEFEDGLKKINDELDQNNQYFNSVAKTKTAVENLPFKCYILIFEPFVEDARRNIDNFANDLKKLKDDIQKVGELYGENKDYKTKDFLNNLMNFAGTIKNILGLIKHYFLS